MSTDMAILLSQFPIAIGIFILAFELRKLRKEIERISREKK